MVLFVTHMGSEEKISGLTCRLAERLVIMPRFAAKLLVRFCGGGGHCGASPSGPASATAWGNSPSPACVFAPGCHPWGIAELAVPAKAECQAGIVGPCRRSWGSPEGVLLMEREHTVLCYALSAARQESVDGGM